MNYVNYAARLVRDNEQDICQTQSGSMNGRWMATVSAAELIVHINKWRLITGRSSVERGLRAGRRSLEGKHTNETS